MTARNQIVGALAGVALYVGTCQAVTTPEYWVHMTPGVKQGALFVNQANPASWFSEWVSVGDGGAMWLNPATGKTTGVEHWVARNGFLLIDYFADSFSTNPRQQRIPANCTKALLQDVPSGAMTELQCDGHGHYYSPWLLPRDAWRLFIWGDVGYKFFWAAEFTPSTATNPCYYAGAQTSDVIVQQEVWWDAVNGWVEGSGGPAYDLLGNPLMPTITYGSESTVMRGEGVVLHQDLTTGLAMCLYSRWLWG